MSVGQSYNVIIPANAEQITFVAVFALTFLDYYIVCRKEYPGPCTKCKSY